MSQWQNPTNQPSPANLVAEVIYTAVTDNTNQLRYRAGEDANYLLDNRKKMSDDEFLPMMNMQAEK
jgi:hypothetical protein